METFKLVLLGIVLLTAAEIAHATPTPLLALGAERCSSNCVTTLRSTNKIVVIARDQQGAIFRTLSFEMPADARLLAAEGETFGSRGLDSGFVQTGNTWDGSTGSQCVNMPGLCTETALRSYATPGFYIFYTYTYVFHDGNLIEINVEETRVARDYMK